MLKYALIIVLTAFSTLFARSDDRSDTTNDGSTEQAPPRKDVYRKLGITSGESTTVPERDPAQEQPQQQQRDDSGNTSAPPRDTSEQPVN